MEIPKFSGLLLLIGILSMNALGATTPERLAHANDHLTEGCQTVLALRFGQALYYPAADNLTVWDAKQQEVRSACRIEPSSSADAAEILHMLVDNWCRFAVKGGGHARNADDSISVGGVTIDMRNMKSIDVSPDRNSARLGSGNVLYTLYHGLEAYNLTTTGGRVADVGLGGYALGGGISNLSPRYGLAVDNVLEYEIVLANATVVKVNENAHPDLYFALRGGMNNFGIVTYFTMRTAPQGQMFGGDKSFTADKRDVIAEEAYKLTTLFRNDTDLSFSYGYSYDQETDQFGVSFTHAYARPVLDPLPFEGINKIPYESSSLRVDWMSNISLEGASNTPSGGRNLYATVTYYPSVELDKHLMRIMEEEIQDVKQSAGFRANIIAQPLPEGAIQAGKERGGNALGIEADGPLTISLLTTRWDDAEDDDAIYSYADRWIERAKRATIREGKDHRWLYINYANQHQDPFSGYGQDNKSRLVLVQRSVDPNGVFSSRGLCRGYFKLQ